MKHIKVFEQFLVESVVNEAELPIGSKLTSGKLGRFYSTNLSDYVEDFNGKYLDNGDFKAGFVKMAPAASSLEKIKKDLEGTGYSLEDIPTEWTKVNEYTGNAKTKYGTGGDPLHHYEVNIYQFIKREGDKLMTAEAVSKPLRKVSDAS